MCCRLTVQPLDIDIAIAVLKTGQFSPSILPYGEAVPEELILQAWHTTKELRRRIELDDGSTHLVTARLVPESNHLRLELSPSISQYMHHALHRVDGGVYFEIAAKYAEKVGGEIKQLSNVAGCTDSGVSEKLLASYPSQPLMWEQVCRGFQEAILGHSHEGVV